jgi:predicted CXXCH cytochrome family protein
MYAWIRSIVLAVAVAAVLALTAGRVVAAIAGTDHDLSSIMPGSQICVACHAPHHVPASPLLWNHVLSTATYKWSDWTVTTGGTTLPTNIDTWTGSTKNCLSCHDGTVERGKIYDPPTTAGTKLTGDKVIAPVTGGVGDLKGNHPVAVPYPFGGVANTYNSLTNGASAVASGWVGAPTKVKIYSAGTPTPTNRGMECASCHDPHGTSNPDFLRDALTGSALCLNCHVK